LFQQSQGGLRSVSPIGSRLRGRHGGVQLLLAHDLLLGQRSQTLNVRRRPYCVCFSGT
jgi:hypothetical protein